MIRPHRCSRHRDEVAAAAWPWADSTREWAGCSRELCVGVPGARHERLAASPGSFARLRPPLDEMDVRALLLAVRVPTLGLHHTDDAFIPPEFGKDIADRISGAKYVELPGRNVFHFVEPWRQSFQEIAPPSPLSKAIERSSEWRRIVVAVAGWGGTEVSRLALSAFGLQ